MRFRGSDLEDGVAALSNVTAPTNSRWRSRIPLPRWWSWCRNSPLLYTVLLLYITYLIGGDDVNTFNVLPSLQELQLRACKPSRNISQKFSRQFQDVEYILTKRIKSLCRRICSSRKWVNFKTHRVVRSWLYIIHIGNEKPKLPAICSRVLRSSIYIYVHKWR